MVAVGLLVLAGSGIVIGAANVDKALVETDGRRKAAETGVREIKVKAKDHKSDQDPPPLCRSGLPSNNAWLDTVSPGDSAGDVNPRLTFRQRSSLRRPHSWPGYPARNRALGVADLDRDQSPMLGEEASHLVDLTEIANATWRSNRGGNQQKRTKSADALKDRLRWRSWEEVR